MTWEYISVLLVAFTLWRSPCMIIVIALQTILIKRAKGTALLLVQYLLYNKDNYLTKHTFTLSLPLCAAFLGTTYFKLIPKKNLLLIIST